MQDSPTLSVFFGTRPQVVKASRLLDALRKRWSVLAVDTGQHYDYRLHGTLYDQLGIAPPDAFLEVGSGAHAEQTAAILTRAAALLADHRPAAAIVIGDTNSTTGAALAAVKLRIPVVHVEAGLRSTDALMPEEINRRLVDAVAGLLCAPSAAAFDVLQRERTDAVIVNTGDIARDVLVHNIARASSLAGHPDWPADVGDRFAFSTIHRAELTGNPAALQGVLSALGALEFPVVLAAHPRTQQVLREHDIRVPSSVHVVPPLGYLEAVAAVQSATVVITDSGGLQREAYWLGIPCVTLRAETEWHETVALGANHLVAPETASESLAPAVAAALSNRGWDRDAYGNGHAAERIVAAIGEWLERPTR